MGFHEVGVARFNVFFCHSRLRASTVRIDELTFSLVSLPH